MGAPRFTRQHVVLGASLLVALLALLIVSPAGVLMLSPAIALVVLIAFGLFPSEQLIARLRRMLRRPRRTPDRPARRPAEPADGRALRPLAFALAVRPPPRAAGITHA
jgi:hypothetical protein